jgi:cytochrome P450
MTDRATIPRVPGLPLLGNLLQLRGDRLALLRDAHARYGDLCRLSVGGTEVTFVTSAELAHQLLVEQADGTIKSRGLHVFARPLLGNGLLSTGDIEHHRRQRRLMSPGFQHRRIAGYAATMAEHAERIQRGWRDGEAIDVAAEMMRLTLGIVAKTLFDAEVEAEAQELGHALTVANHYLIEEVTSLVHVPIGWPTPRNVRARRAIKRLDETIYRIIRARRALGEDTGDVLSMLLDARDADGSGMTDVEVRDEAMTVFLAGHETTANAMAWCWLLLARHPDVADRLRAEADAALGGRTPTFEDLRALPYALQVFKEALRLYPPAYFIGRQATRELRLGAHRLPAGSLAFVNIYGMHRRPDVFAEPSRFDPERFAPEREKQLPRLAFMPFGAGPRVCIGNHFALMEGQILLATLAQRIRFASPEAAVSAEPLLTLRPRGGLTMRVARRDHAERARPAA